MIYDEDGFTKKRWAGLSILAALRSMVGRIPWGRAVQFLIPGALIVGATVALATWGPSLSSFLRDTGQLQELMVRWGRWAPFATVGLHVAQVIAAPIPGTALDVVNGFLFGPWLGTLLSMVGLAIGSALAMGIARRFGRPLVERLVDPKWIDRLDGFSRRRGALFIFMIFLLPYLPDDAICLVAGLTPIPLLELIILAVVGRLPGAFFANWLGANTTALSPAEWGLIGATLLVTGVVFWRGRGRVEDALLNLADHIVGWAKSVRGGIPRG